MSHTRIRPFNTLESGQREPPDEAESMQSRGEDIAHICVCPIGSFVSLAVSILR